MNWAELFRQMKAGLVEHSVRAEAEKALEKYPFFAMARMIVAKAATKEGDLRAHGLRFLASLYAPHRQYYAFFMGDRVRPMVAPPPRIGGHEGEAPRQAPSKQEESPSSSDEPGPVETMPFSPAYLPRLQGQLRAKLHLYRGLSQRLRQAIRLPDLPPLSAASEPSSALSAPESSSQTSVLPTPSPHPAEFETSFSEKSIPALPPEGELASTSHRLPPLLLTLQFELSDKPPATKADAPSAPSEESTLALSPHVEASAEGAPAPSAVEPGESEASPVSGEVPLKPLEERAPGPLPQSEASREAPLTPPPGEPQPTFLSEEALPEPISAFTRPYIPLEDPEAPVSPSTSAAQTPAEHTTPEPISAFTRPYVPLENPEAPVAPSKFQSPAQEPSGQKLSPEVFQSENPIRLIILPEFDPEASIHLKVPEPGSPSTEEVARPAASSAPAPSEVGESSPAASTLTPSWQSFLSEIEQPLTQVAQEALPQTPHTLEKLRQAFIRYLLQARKERRIVHEPPPPSTAIEEVLRLLETFQPKGEESPSPPSFISVPESETPAAPPPIYTETMARLCWKQGDLPLAIEIYEKLKARHPEKAAYYEAQITRIQRGELP